MVSQAASDLLLALERIDQLSGREGANAFLMMPGASSALGRLSHVRRMRTSMPPTASTPSREWHWVH